jgi:hypothetical protein
MPQLLSRINPLAQLIAVRMFFIKKAVIANGCRFAIHLALQTTPG